MTTRPAVRPLRRYGKARVRAAGLPVSYTTNRDTTFRTPYDGARPPSTARPTSIR